jgi:hypothetical protein
MEEHHQHNEQLSSSLSSDNELAIRQFVKVNDKSISGCSFTHEP